MKTLILKARKYYFYISLFFSIKIYYNKKNNKLVN